MNKIVSIFVAMILALGVTGSAFAAEKSTDNSSAKSVQIVEKVNINSADAETIANNLHRVGVKKAEAIVAYREAHGKFTSVEQLLEVKGIGEAILANNRDRLVL